MRAIRENRLCVFGPGDSDVVILPARLDEDAVAALRSRRRAWLEAHPHYRNIRVFHELAL